MSQKGRLHSVARRLDEAFYGLFAAGVTLAFAHAFYGYMRVQTRGEWSAPLDDVFIHFDYARAIARGYPFEWSEGNGFSSGNTSLTYPFVLAAGYWAGFRGPLLVVWAGIIACFSIWGALLAAPRLFRGLPPWTKYIAPLALHSVGALVWSLFSGMEVAFYLGVWALALIAMLAVIREQSERSRARREWLLGGAGVLLVLTRPEGATSIAVLGMGAAIALRARGVRPTIATLLRAGGPAVVALLAQAGFNHWLTGESASNGAVTKLFVYNPFLTTAERLERFAFLLKYVVFRNIDYHFADAPPYGWILPLLAAIPLASRRTRFESALLWAMTLSWLLVVSLNTQVRWQNERYTMPAVAWLLLSAALGIGLLLSYTLQLPRHWRERAWPTLSVRMASGAAALLLTAGFVVHQAPRMRDQLWFFARASRNIRDQQITAGRILRRLEPIPQRVLVGDAGAITYAADLPGLDLIGLGGYGKLPFARAGVHGLGARLELLERVPPEDRPDYFALYPSWWGNFPSWFGSYVLEVPVHGNVICGGAEKVIYRADWSALDTGSLPRTLGDDEEIVDELDVGDLVSEREHAYIACPTSKWPFDREACESGEESCHLSRCGMTDARLLPDPARPAREMFDAGRQIHSGEVERFRLTRRKNSPARVIVRTVGDRATSVSVSVDGARIGELEIAVGGWQELSIDLPDSREVFTLELQSSGEGWVNHHVWVAQPK